MCFQSFVNFPDFKNIIISNFYQMNVNFVIAKCLQTMNIVKKQGARYIDQEIISHSRRNNAAF